MERYEKYKDSGVEWIGEIPDGWNTSKLNHSFEEMFIDKFIERMDQNQEIFEKILENQSFGSLVKELMMKKVYARLNEVGQQSRHSEAPCF